MARRLKGIPVVLLMFIEMIATMYRIFSFIKQVMSLRWLIFGMLAVVVCFGMVDVGVQVARADTEPYEVGPIRQTHDPLSDENFQGGVDPSALNEDENVPQAEEDEGIIESIKERFRDYSSEPERPDLKTQKNPTLKRYTEEQR